MDFVCVLSVEGSLLSYEVYREQPNRYLAKLKSPAAGKDNEFNNITLEKKGDNWVCDPDHNDIGKNLIRCIEARLVEQF